ncbi:MAG: ATP-dependent Clp protease proteolytic subunit [Bryobacteraceae bacterium]|jgi:ATP-dependent protease ClpP protease subunit
MQPPSIKLPVQALPPFFQQQLQQNPPHTIYINFSAEIIPGTTETLIATVANASNQGVKTVYLMLSTPGGQVMNGLNLYNVLRGLPVELITHNVGNVDSIGNMVFMAGAKRYACRASTFMFHGVAAHLQATVASNTGPLTVLGEKELRERLGAVQADQNRIGAIIKDRTRLDETAIETLFLEAQTKDANWALSCGVIDEIREIQVPPGSPVVSLVFQR